MVKIKDGDSYVELKVLTAVLEEKLSNFKEHVDESMKSFEKKFNSKVDEINRNFDKGTKRMTIIETDCVRKCEKLKKEVATIKRWKRDIVVGVSTIAAFVSAILNIIPWLWRNALK